MFAMHRGDVLTSVDTDGFLCISVFVALEQILGESFSLSLISRSFNKMSCQFVGLLSNLVVS